MSLPDRFSRSNPAHQALTREAMTFLVLGLGTTFIYMVISYVAITVFGVGRIPTTILAFLISAVVSYLANTRWTFQAPMDHATFLRFLLVCGIGFLLNLLIVAVGGFLHFSWWIGAWAAVCLVPVFNFLGHRMWTFKPHRVRS